MNDLVLAHLDLPRRLYWSRLRKQCYGRVLGADECIAVGNLELVKAAGQWLRYNSATDIGRFREYAAKAIFHAVHREYKRVLRRTAGQVGFNRHLAEQEEAEVSITLEDWETIQMTLNRLPQYDRELLLGIADGLTFAELAERHSCSKTNIQKWYKLALKKARQIVDQLTGCQG